MFVSKHTMFQSIVWFWSSYRNIVLISQFFNNNNKIFPQNDEDVKRLSTNKHNNKNDDGLCLHSICNFPAVSITTSTYLTVVVHVIQIRYPKRLEYKQKKVKQSEIIFIFSKQSCNIYVNDWKFWAHTRFEQPEANIMYFGLKLTHCTVPGCIPSRTEILFPLSEDHTCILPVDDPENKMA